MESRFTAVVMRSTGSWYEVMEEGNGRRGDGDSSEGGDRKLFKARIRGRLRLEGSRSTNPVVVGDRVVCSLSGGGDGTEDGDGGGNGGGTDCGGSPVRGEKHGAAHSPARGEVWIEEILPRTNHIIRRSTNLSRQSHIIAANIDRALVVATLFSPATPPEFIDRFLVTCEAYGVPAAVVLGKMDLASAASPEAVERFTGVYRGAGYRVIHASAVTGQGIEELRDYLRGRTTLVAGNSGVGKSTLVGAASPGLDIRTGEISRAHGKGMHTTTFSQMYPLAGGGYVIDSPGIKGFGLVDIGGGELYHYFPDLMRFAAGCQYYNCTHTHEPGCAVVRAVESGGISEERYSSYLKMLEEDGKYR